MAITLHRQISDEEKEIVLKRHGQKCFATGHSIPDGEQVLMEIGVGLEFCCLPEWTVAVLDAAGRTARAAAPPVVALRLSL